MAEKVVIIDFDFAVMDGATLLYDTTRKFLKKLDNLKLDEALEARCFAGNAIQKGLENFFAIQKTKKTAVKAARDLSAAFIEALNREVPNAISIGFKNFIKAMLEKDVAVMIRTRADLEAVEAAFKPLLNDQVVLSHEDFDVYGAVKWESWCRSYMAMGMTRSTALAITGSGFGVKSAMLVGVTSVAVVSDHVAYQDFGGASEVVNEISGKTAKNVFRALHID